MSFLTSRAICIYKMVHNVCSYTTLLLKRPLAYKSEISLENLYPNSSLKLSTPSFIPDSNSKFSGFIPVNKLDISYSASSGPGGQNVNKVHTKVDMRFKVSEADWLHPDVRQRVAELHGSKLTREGYLVIRSDATRSQQMNVADCLRKLRALLRDAAVTERAPEPHTGETIRKRQLKAARLRVAVKREQSLQRNLSKSPSVQDL